MLQLLIVVLLATSPVFAGLPANTGGLWISTMDEPRQCRQTSITLSGGVSPYKLVVVRGDDYQTELETIQEDIKSAGEIIWLCNVQKDTSFALKVVDCQSKLSLLCASDSPIISVNRLGRL